MVISIVTVVTTLCHINLSFIRVVCDLEKEWGEAGLYMTLMDVPG
jgi:hypothetical protein